MIAFPFLVSLALNFLLLWIFFRFYLPDLHEDNLQREQLFAQTQQLRRALYEALDAGRRGEPGCKYFSYSQFLGCAVHPSGPCDRDKCPDFESRPNDNLAI